MNYLEQLNLRLAVKKQASFTALDKVVQDVTAQTAIESTVLKYGIAGMHKGQHKDSLSALHKRADVETGNSQKLMAGNYPTGYHASQSAIHEDLADAFRSHGLENHAGYHDRLAVAHDAKAGGDGSGLRQNKTVTKSDDKYSVLKYGVKGMKRGVRKPSGAGGSPKTNITGDAGEGHNAEDVHDAFNAFGKSGGGHNFTPNVMMHKDSAQAQIHAGAMHGHLQDSGFQMGKVHNENNITSTEYHHPNGTKVLLNLGASGGRNFVGYHHETNATRAADFGTKPKAVEPAKEAPKEEPKAAPSEAPKAKALPSAAKANPSAIGTDGKVDEAKFNKGLKKIQRLTDINDHNMALHHGAKLVGRDDIAAKAKAISVQHLKQGHMSSDLMSKRHALHDELQAHAKKVLSPAQAHSLYMSY